MSKLVTRGYGAGQLITTRGFGSSVVVPVIVPTVAPGSGINYYPRPDDEWYHVVPIHIYRDIEGAWLSVLPDTVFTIEGGVIHDVEYEADIYGRIISYIEELYEVWGRPKTDVETQLKLDGGTLHVVEREAQILSELKYIIDTYMKASGHTLHENDFSLKVRAGASRIRKAEFKIRGAPVTEIVEQILVEGAKDLKSTLEELIKRSKNA